MKKMSDKQRESEEKMTKELRNYENDMRSKMERQQEERRRREKENI